MAHSDLVFLHSGHMPSCKARVDKYFTGYYTLQFMQSGGVELFYDEQQHFMQGAWLWAAFPGPHIRFHLAPGHASWCHRYVAFRGALASHWRAEGLLNAEPQPALQTERTAETFDELLGHVQRAGRWGTSRAINVLEGLLLELAEARAAPTTPEPWLQGVLEVLEREDNFAPDYAALAHCHGMALSTLRRRFREATGTALHTYVLQKRIATARTLLGESSEPIKAIAARLGYKDVFFFARQFREQTGVTPANYRSSCQG